MYHNQHVEDDGDGYNDGGDNHNHDDNGMIFRHVSSTCIDFIKNKVFRLLAHHFDKQYEYFVVTTALDVFKEHNHANATLCAPIELLFV